MKTKSGMNRCWKRRYAVTVVACLTLVSCQTIQTRSSMTERYVDLSDPCQPMRSLLIGTQDHFSRNIAGGVAIGVITGVVAGLASGDRKKAWRNALIGGVAGAAGGYLKAKAEQARNREDLRRAINSDVQRDTRRVTEMEKILGSLKECRHGQVAAIKRGFDDGSVNAEQTRASLQIVRASVEGDNKLIEEILGGVAERKGVYVESIATVENKTKEEVLGPKVETEHDDSLVPEQDDSPVTSTRYFAQKGSNVRAEPSTDASVLGVLPAGTPVDVVGPAGNGAWYEVRYEDGTAYVYGELLGATAPETALETTIATAKPEDTDRRPKPENDVQALDRASEDVRAQQQAAAAELFRELDELEELTGTV